MKTIKDRVAVITGGGSGIGKGIALALSGAGAKIVVADINEASANEAAAEIAARGGKALAVKCDVVDPTAFETLRDKTLAEFGQVDIIVNNAGVILSGMPEDIPVAEFARIVDILLMSVVRSNAVFLPMFLAKGEGHIVNTSSFAGLYTYAYDRLAYSAAKAAVFNLTEGLALYLKPKGIGVTALCPGPVQTNIMHSNKIWTENQTIMRGPGAEFRLMSADEVGALVLNAIREGIFFLPTDPLVIPKLVKRAEDADAFLQDQLDHPHIIDLAAIQKAARERAAAQIDSQKQ
jgi:NAD(P)-dependent dehydrogenase (short-subunit alcohol dehydrogenase family)